jgi:hypothetical protein
MAHPWKLVLGAVLFTAAGGAGGFFAGKRARPASSPRGWRAPAVAVSTEDGACKGELVRARNELSICLAYYHPVEVDLDAGAAPESDALAQCREQRKACSYEREVGNCVFFERLAPFFEQTLGPAGALSAEDEAATRALGQDECREILHWGGVAREMRRSCLRGLARTEAPASYPTEMKEHNERFPETYGEGKFSIEERAMFKICKDRFTPPEPDAATKLRMRQEMLDKATVHGKSVRQLLLESTDAGTIRMNGEDVDRRTLE